MRKHLRISILLVGLLGMLISFYYGSQQAGTDLILRSEELFALGIAALICIISGFIFIGVWLRRKIRWLRKRRVAQPQTSHRVQSAPLQQQKMR